MSKIVVHIARADIHVDGNLDEVLDRLTALGIQIATQGAHQMTALDDARARITAGLNELLDIARSLKARVDAQEDTSEDAAQLGADADRLMAGIEELRNANEQPPVEEPVPGDGGDENPSLPG